MQAVANINGEITPYSEAKIPISDRGFLYGDSIYEVTRTYQGVPFYLEEHFARLENSARLAMMKIFQSREFLVEEIKRTVKASGVQPGQDVFVRFTITRGEGPLDIVPPKELKTSFVIMVKEVPNWNMAFYEKGMVLAIPPTVRNSPLALDPNIKSGNYLNNILAVIEAKNMGADDSLILSLEGKLTEAANSNVNFIINGELCTPKHEPKTSTGNLIGITRTIVGMLAERIGITYNERPMFPADILNASECFVSSATREIMPVCKIIQDNKPAKIYPDGGGEIIRKLQQEYKKYIGEYIAQRQSKAWF